MKHRDRSYIIHKLNKSVQLLRGEEDKKKVVRSDYLNLYKTAADGKEKEKPVPYQEKSNAQSPSKKKTAKGEKSFLAFGKR